MNTIDNENDCNEAALCKGKDRDSSVDTETASEYPRGCYVNDGEVYFNHHTVGNREESSAPICQKSILLYLQIRLKNKNDNLGSTSIVIIICTFLLGIYRPNFNKLCDLTGDIQSTSFQEAELNCTKDDSCIGFYDSCGEGNKFYMCNHQKTRVISSKCGSILYLAASKFAPY